ncbi:MAG TPA: thioredoxin-disulfide reductase [Methanobacterium sp.]|nr:thioredoxin-disulfide reductase [Methanobacterium sp.]
MDEYDVIIIGSGPAGLTAALYSGRQHLKTLVIEKALAGGMGSMVPHMENYPGFDEISGKQLIELMKIQTLKYAEIQDREEVKKIENDPENEYMIIHTSKDIYKARAVILATGSRHRELGAPGEGQFLGRGVAYCATCDGPLFIDRKVLVAGGGNSAAQQAVYLDDIGVLVAMIHRRDNLRAENYLQALLKEREIPIIWNSTIEEIKGDVTVQSVLINNRVTGEQKDLPIDGVFIAVGEIPSNQLALDLGVELDKQGYINVDKSQRTNISRIYAAGDITDGVNQWVVACSEGAIAALSAYNDLQIKK